MTEGQADLPELGEPPREPPVAPAIADEPLATEKALREPAAPSTPPAPPGPDPERRPEDPQRERPGAGVPPPPPLFGRPDPHGKARRLARALISDIAVYNPERRDRSIAGGTLRQEFRDEIRKSWDEYVAQVGETIARGTPYFREALNEILAGGRPVF